MFIKLTRRGPNQYVQLVAAYRDEAGHRETELRLCEPLLAENSENLGF